MASTSGLGQIPLMSSDAEPLLATNTLIQQINSQLLSGVATVGAQFSTTAAGSINTAQLAPATFAAQILILVELRIQTNLLAMNRGSMAVGDLGQARAEELNNILPGATL